MFWRTYWKGWLEGRPSVWHNYLEDLDKIQNNLKELIILKTMRKQSMAATGIDCFDSLGNRTKKIWLFTQSYSNVVC